MLAETSPVKKECRLPAVLDLRTFWDLDRNCYLFEFPRTTAQGHFFIFCVRCTQPSSPGFSSKYHHRFPAFVDVQSLRHVCPVNKSRQPDDFRTSLAHRNNLSLSFDRLLSRHRRQESREGLATAELPPSHIPIFLV